MKRENKYNRILDIFYRAFKGEEFTAERGGKFERDGYGRRG